MKLVAVLTVLGLCVIAIKGHTPKNSAENGISEKENKEQQSRDNFLNFLIVSDKSDKQFPTENANDHARKKRTLFAAAYALQRQQARWQNRLQRRKLKNERNNLRNQYRLKTLNDTNQKLKAQIDQWTINQELSRQQYQQRWADINKQLNYPMNFQQYSQMQNNMKQHFPPLNFQFQQHQFPNKTPQSPISTVVPTTKPTG